MEFVDNVVSWCRSRYEEFFIKPIFRDQYVTIYKTRKGIAVDTRMNQDEMEKKYNHIIRGLMLVACKCGCCDEYGKVWERDERE